MKSEVFWKNPGYKVRPPLEKDIECDYLIVGGGITGVSLAYFLAKEVATRENLECDLEPQDAIYASTKKGHDSFIFEEYKTAKSMEQSIELVTGEKLREAVNTPLFRHALIYKNHGVSVNPLAFTQNL